jgi:hypothetical protein
MSKVCLSTFHTCKILAVISVSSDGDALCCSNHAPSLPPGS